MVTPLIVPDPTYGSATLTLVSSSEDYYTYRITATPAPGKQLVSIEYTYHSVLGSIDLGTQTEFVPNGGTVSEGTLQLDIADYTVTTISIVVTFKSTYETARVSAIIVPEDARGTVEGTGDYTIGSMVTLIAHQKCNLWIFDRWGFSTGETYRTRSVTFPVRQDVMCTAYFRHENTGGLIYDADGGGDPIIGDNGALLYNGDLIIT